MSQQQLLRLCALALALTILIPIRDSATGAEIRLPAGELQKKIASLDAALFDAYNRCDLPAFSRFLADDLELYHDQDGLVLGPKTLIDNLRKYVCGGDVVRELVPGTLQVHRIEGYGALCTGIHRFRHPKTNAAPSERSFVNLWRYKDGVWKVTRAISFDHRSKR
ncbi:MAG: nuclear transport factor 2 family protein [Bryobacterales bacterium]|nr:nuclear transport factor 2 family protein [Bryobacterales bacterium]